MQDHWLLGGNCSINHQYNMWKPLLPPSCGGLLTRHCATILYWPSGFASQASSTCVLQETHFLFHYLLSRDTLWATSCFYVWEKTLGARGSRNKAWCLHHLTYSSWGYVMPKNRDSLAIWKPHRDYLVPTIVYTFVVYSSSVTFVLNYTWINHF